MASQSFNLIGQEEEQELVAFGTRQSRGPTPQSRPNSRMEELLSHLVKIQEETVKSQDAIERIKEFHTVGPEVQGIETTVEALFPVERIGVAQASHNNTTVHSRYC